MKSRYTGYKKGNRDREHREIAKANGINIDGLVVHHIDGDGHNNSLDNLAFMTTREHIRLHHNIKPDEPTSTEYVPEECPNCNHIHLVQYRCTKRLNYTGLCKACNGKLNGVNK